MKLDSSVSALRDGQQGTALPNERYPSVDTYRKCVQVNCYGLYSFIEVFAHK